MTSVFEIPQKDRLREYYKLQKQLMTNWQHVNPDAIRDRLNNISRRRNAGHAAQADIELKNLKRDQKIYLEGARERYLLDILTGEYDYVLLEIEAQGGDMAKAANIRKTENPNAVRDSESQRNYLTTTQVVPRRLRLNYPPLEWNVSCYANEDERIIAWRSKPIKDREQDSRPRSDMRGPIIPPADWGQLCYATEKERIAAWRNRSYVDRDFLA